MARSVEIADGAAVVDAKGRAIGRVIVSEYEHIVVERGFMFTRSLYIPTKAIARVEAARGNSPGKVHLNISRAEAEKIGKNDTFAGQLQYVGTAAGKSRFTRMGETATAGLEASRHTPDDYAAPSSYGDPWNGGDLTPDDVAREGVPTLSGNAPDDLTIFEQAQRTRRPAPKQ